MAITNILNFLTQSLVNVPLILELLFIPHACMVLLFDYFIVKYTIYISIRSIKGAIAIYNKFKL